jgi:hypothetical protein
MYKQKSKRIIMANVLFAQLTATEEALLSGGVSSLELTGSLESKSTATGSSVTGDVTSVTKSEGKDDVAKGMFSLKGDAK